MKREIELAAGDILYVQVGAHTVYIDNTNSENEPHPIVEILSKDDDGNCDEDS